VAGQPGRLLWHKRPVSAFEIANCLTDLCSDIKPMRGQIFTHGPQGLHLARKTAYRTLYQREGAADKIRSRLGMPLKQVQDATRMLCKLKFTLKCDVVF